MIFPYVPEGHFAVTLTLLMWSIIEIIRYPFYTIKALPVLKDGALAKFLGHLRYNAFIVNYPVGVLGELIACYGAYETMKKLDKMPFSLEMPNSYNFAFKFDYLLLSLPVVYGLFFPQLYGHMWIQRKKFYSAPSEDSKVKRS
jgi:very-long-chain (3R)-3-hydroxyacyl-CoA dehydratase